MLHAPAPPWAPPTPAPRRRGARSPVRSRFRTLAGARALGSPEPPPAAPTRAPLCGAGLSFEFGPRRAPAAAAALRRLRALPAGTRRLLAGGAAGALAKTATAPLEAVKLQLVQGRAGALEAAARLYAAGGAAAFFRGNLLDVARSTPSKAIELAAFEALRRPLLALSRPAPAGARRASKGGAAPAAANGNGLLSAAAATSARVPLLPPDLAVGLAGALAGVASTVAVSSAASLS
jgi:hypothetical protein